MHKKIGVMFAMSVLTGCAGMNSDFEHTIPAKDSGYWLQQADDMTNSNMMNKSGSPIGVMTGRVDVKQYHLINMYGIRLPIKNISAPQVQQNDHEKDIFEPPINVRLSSATSTQDQMNCNIKFCYPEPMNPLRRDDHVSRVWIAPYVSPDDNAHLGEIVYFVTKKSQWAGLEKQGGK